MTSRDPHPTVRSSSGAICCRSCVHRTCRRSDTAEESTRRRPGVSARRGRGCEQLATSEFDSGCNLDESRSVAEPDTVVAARRASPRLVAFVGRSWLPGEPSPVAAQQRTPESNSGCLGRSANRAPPACGSGRTRRACGSWCPLLHLGYRSPRVRSVNTWSGGGGVWKILSTRQGTRGSSDVTSSG